MALYSAAVRTAATGVAAIAALHTGVSDRVRVREIGVTNAAAVAATLGLYRPSTVGTPSTPATGVSQDPNDVASSCTVVTAWSVPPAIATNVPLRRLAVPATIATGIIWTFGPNDLIVSVSSSLLLWNIVSTAGVLLDVYFTWDQ